MRCKMQLYEVVVIVTVAYALITLPTHLETVGKVMHYYYNHIMSQNIYVRPPLFSPKLTL